MQRSEELQNKTSVKNVCKLLKEIVGPGESDGQGNKWFPAGNGKIYHVHTDQKSWMSMKSSQWAPKNNEIDLRKLQSEYEAIRDHPEKTQVNQKQKFLDMLAELIKRLKNK